MFFMAILTLFLPIGFIKAMITFGDLDRKWLICVVVYAFLIGFLNLMFGQAILVACIGLLIRLAVGSLYFWLLEILEGAGVLWWLVMLPGFLILIIL